VKSRVQPVHKYKKISRRIASPEQTVRAIYRRLSRSWGPQNWWPAASPFEVIVGAILTQNTSWTNVERALANLRAAGLLSVIGIRELAIEELEALVRPSGYYRQKAQRLTTFVAFLDEKHGGSLDAMFSTPTAELRAELLALNGVGPETADSILLYAGHHATFVVDAYTRRILERHDAVTAAAQHDEIRELVEAALRREKPSPEKLLDPRRPQAHSPSAMSTARREPRAQVYNEMHGLIVQAGKHYCRKQQPECDQCPLGPLLQRAVQTGTAVHAAGNSASAILKKASKKQRKSKL
jgi:endonuclease-3 related protein